MENNFDITKIYMETNKKKIRFTNIFSVFLNREKSSNNIINVNNFERKNNKKEKGMDRKNIRKIGKIILILIKYIWKRIRRKLDFLIYLVYF